MTEWERIEAILHWISTFNPENKEFLQDPFVLLDGVAISQVYNSVSNDTIDPKLLKKIADNSWVNMLMNLRLIASRISPLLKENGIEMTVDMSKIARKKDQGELYKFLKFLLYYAIKAPNKKNTISAIRSLDKSYQNQIQSVLEEIVSPAKKPAPAQPQAQQPSDNMAQLLSKEKSLQEELEKLKSQASNLRQTIESKTKEIEELNSRTNFKIEDRQSEIKAQYQNEVNKRKSLDAELLSSQNSIKQLQESIQSLKQRQSELVNEMQKDANAELSVQQLEAKLTILKQKIINITDSKISSDESPENIVDLLDLVKKREALQTLRDEISEHQKIKTIKTAESNALKSTYELQNQKASLAMRKRIAQLNAELDKMPLGETKRKILKLKRVIEKLKSEITKIADGGSQMELEALQNELQIMAQRKADESDLLAKKLSFMQSTLGQCDLRLQRLKLNTTLQVHANRLRRYRNCFNIE
ncbi:hypothetical protein GPJ56_010669 [Histomonas meleagridis]|uniref:uncharacterized protein n=1 Tax=Histomonas meleagridis TaxID=135588 RepID=UPI00355AAA0F|nr:hypothetical protein GPJ56_010669 [Histomonas meleagridis]KAH0806941.1 hypothetical protein GO595_000117 [Histomonas meleagridis]